MRIACVQNGDYTTPFNALRAGGRETYNGQRYTIDAFGDFVRGMPSVVISLDAAAHEERDAWQTRMSFGSIRRANWYPHQWQLRSMARRIIDRLDDLGITHLLLRCVDLIGCELLEWAGRQHIPTAAIIAARFDASQLVNRRFCTLANGRHVSFVANHNRVATESLIECGIDPHKAIAWDLPPAVTPDRHSARTREAGQMLRVISAGSVEPAKGIGDLVQACAQARAAGIHLQLTVCGEGPLLPELRRHPGVRQGWLECTGRIPQGEVVHRMLAADVVAVPSRSAFPEGLPFVIQEALAVRAPLVLSDHPVFLRYFSDGAGVRIFRQSDPTTLTRLLAELANDSSQYARLSRETAAVWTTLACPTQFHQLLDRLSSEWGLTPPVTRVEKIPQEVATALS